MASHDVALKVATELPVGAVDLEIPVKRNGRKIGTFTVNANGVSWNPSTSKAPTSVSWEDLPGALSSAAPAAAAAPAKKAAAKKTTAKKATSKKAAAPAPAPQAGPEQEATPEPAAAETAPEATESTESTETPAPAKRASGRRSATKKSAPAAKKSAPAAKKSAPAASTGAVDARAVRQWAAENGITVAPRGPISSSIIDQFRAAGA